LHESQRDKLAGFYIPVYGIIAQAATIIAAQTSGWVFEYPRERKAFTKRHRISVVRKFHEEAQMNGLSKSRHINIGNEL